MKSSPMGRLLGLSLLAQSWLVSNQTGMGQTYSRARIFHAIADTEDSHDVAQVPVRHTRSKDFVLPFHLTENEKSSATEVQLFVRTPDSPWQKRASAGPREGKFEFKVLDEGEIWFAVVTCDSTGTTTPPEPRTMPPALRVLVDTTSPVIEMKAEPGKPPVNQPMLRLEAKDLNPDPQSLSVACFTGGSWHALTPQTEDQSLFALPPAATGTWKIRAICRDKAGNQANFEGQFPPTENKKTGAGEVADKNAQPAPSTANPATPITQGLKNTLAPAEPASGPAFKENPAPAVTSAKEIGNPAPDKAKSPEPAPPSKLVVNSFDTQLEYAVEEIGPSGVSRVDVWVTKDKGLTWKILAEDTDGTSPADCKLPGEGEYGLNLVITNGSGAQGKAPTPGDKPEIILEVDTTFPSAKLGYAQVLANEGKDGSALFVKWEAKDKNLGEKPIRLLLAESREGPYIPFGEPLANTGEFRWPVPANIPPKMFLKMEVMDAAGNLTQVEHPSALLMDPARPKGKVLAVRPAKAANSTSPMAPKPAQNELIPARFETESKLEQSGKTPEPLAKPEPAPPAIPDHSPSGSILLPKPLAPAYPKAPI